MNMFSFDVVDSVAIITLDEKDKPVNVVSPAWLDEMNQVISKVKTDDSIIGAVITSGKSSFMAGADLKVILEMMEEGITPAEAEAFSESATQMHRSIETCGKPFVAAINGLALGGGYELCLACHYRVVIDSRSVTLGLPESTVGLLAGSGGTQRLTRMIGIDKAIPYIVDGVLLGAKQALESGLVDEIVTAEQLIGSAKQWVINNPSAQQPWDRPSFDSTRFQSENPDERLQQMLRLENLFHGNYPAPIANLNAIFEGLALPFDQALVVESKYFAELMCGNVAKSIIRTSFVNKGLADKLSRRPSGVPKSSVETLGVLGAGMMGAGISYVAAKVGINVVLFDRSIELAEKGKQYAVNATDKAVSRGKMAQEKSTAIVGRITTTQSVEDLSQCDFIVEAVFEDRDIKANVTKAVEAVLPATSIFGSNTSTLPISGLAEASVRPDQFIGTHFFSPVDRMPLVEVIIGQQTSEQTLAKTLDFVKQMRMTPILVNDSRGFYTSRVFQTYIHEGMSMLREGVEPSFIEDAGKSAGMPLGPLALLDEITIELPWKIVCQSIADLGDGYVRPDSYPVMQQMVEEFKRIGRRDGAGFYDHEGRTKTLWPGLASAFPVADAQPDSDELVKRFLHIQAMETARCMEENVLTHPADGDIGALMGWSFPKWTGGPLSYIDNIGIALFVAECEEMSIQYGRRYLPSSWLKAKAAAGKSFYS